MPKAGAAVGLGLGDETGTLTDPQLTGTVPKAADGPGLGDTAGILTDPQPTGTVPKAADGPGLGLGDATGILTCLELTADVQQVRIELL